MSNWFPPPGGLVAAVAAAGKVVAAEPVEVAAQQLVTVGPLLQVWLVVFD